MVDDEADQAAGDREQERGKAIDHLEQALAIFDRVGPFSVAATISLAMTQAGRDPPPPPQSP